MSLEAPRKQTKEVVFVLACKHGCDKQTTAHMPWNSIQAEHFDSMRSRNHQHVQAVHDPEISWNKYLSQHTLDDLTAWSPDWQTQYAIPEIEGVAVPGDVSDSDRSRSRTPWRRGGSRGSATPTSRTTHMPDGFKLNSFQREVLRSLRVIEDSLSDLKNRR